MLTNFVNIFAYLSEEVKMRTQQFYFALENYRKAQEDGRAADMCAQEIRVYLKMAQIILEKK